MKDQLDIESENITTSENVVIYWDDHQSVKITDTIIVSRQHWFFILKKILGSTGATGAREYTLVGGRIIRFSDNDTNSKKISYSRGH